MAILKSYQKPTNHQKRASQTIKQVAEYCLPHMLLAIMIPFIILIVGLVMRYVNLTTVAEFTVDFIAFPLALLSIAVITIKEIYALRGAFPRETNDKNTVILSILFFSAFCVFLLISLFHFSCYLLGLFPMDFRGAAFIRDMYRSSPAAINIFYVAIFFFVNTLSQMTISSYFIGHNKQHRLKFSYSCLIFILMYVILLLVFILSYFIATFLDIIALERIQISNSIFNSSILCSFVTFIVISIPYNIILYFIARNTLSKIKKNCI